MALSEEPKSGQRRIRFFRVALKSGLVLGLFVGLIVYTARIPDQYACLQWVNGFGRGSFNLNVLDLKSGNTMPDSRSQQSAPFGVTSPDGKLRVTTQPGRTGSTTQSLVIQRDGDPNNPPAPIVVQQDFPGSGNSFDQLRSVRWSPDGKRLAYLWSDGNQRTYLSVVNADGSGKQTAEFQRSRSSQSSSSSSTRVQSAFGNPMTFRWSVDGAYLNIEEATNGPNLDSLWSINTLQRIQGALPASVRIGVWSPKENRFAAIVEDSNSNQALIIWSPEKQVEIPLEGIGTSADQVFWSPNGRYLTLQSQRQCSSLENCTTRWSFDIYSSTGSALVSNLDSISADSSSTSTYSPPTLIATWSIDGESWIFLQPQGVQENLVSLHVADNTYTTIASDIVADLGQDMLFPQAFSRRGGQFRNASFVRSLASQRIVIPTRQNGKINVELADVDGGHRTTLVQGADEILDPSFTQPGNSNHFWIFPGEYVIVAWAKTDTNNVRTVHLTWAAVDGSGKHELDEPLGGISHIQLTQVNGQRWLGFMASHDTDHSLEIADLNTGKHYRLLDGMEDFSQWSLTPEPQGTVAAIQLGAYANRFYGETTLYLAALDGSWTQQISSQAIGPVQWSPDGSKLAYLWQGSSTTVAYAQIVAANGQPLQLLPVRQSSSGNNQQPRLYGWSQCT